MSNIPLSDRLPRLRRALGELGVEGFIQPRADAHLGEYIPKAEERLAWLTGFTGSAGTVVVTAEHACLFVDGRYTVQGAAQAADRYTVIHIADQSRDAWLGEHIAAGQRIGIDPWTLADSDVQKLEQLVQDKGATLVLLDANPIDPLWADRPAAPTSTVVPHPPVYAGRDSADKRADIADELTAAGQDAVVLSQMDAVAWLLNIRGADVVHCPLARSFFLLRADASGTWFIEKDRLDEAARAQVMASNTITIAAPDQLGAMLDQLGAAGATVRIDPKTTTSAIAARLRTAGAVVLSGDDPTALPRARKNDAELNGMRAAHARDGLAMVQLFRWLDQQLASGTTITEVDIATRLSALRAALPLAAGDSFGTISAYNAHAALPHYQPTAESNCVVEPTGLLKLDSGGQYLDGTTDITRTVAVGPVTDEMRTMATLVLKGHVAVSMLRFPVGTAGVQIDAIARYPQWTAGFDYDHGTGHGVGAYLNVHEGPQRIAKKGSDIPLEIGMILSNEPGYYRQGAFGVRIENLVIVQDAGLGPDGRSFLSFETLTLCPYDRRLIELSLLTAAECAWIDAYHAQVRTTLAPGLDGEDLAWLERETAPLG